MPFARVLYIPVVFLLAAVCAGCEGRTPGAAAEAAYPFELANLRVDGRRAEMDLVREPGSPVEDPGQVSLLVVFSVDDDPDVLGLGTRARKGTGIHNDELGGWVIFSTLIGKDVKDYRGAWWMVRFDAPEDWNRKDHIALDLPQMEYAGKIVGEGTFTALLVRGNPGRGDFEALSEPVVVHRPAEEPQTQQATG